MQHIQIGGSIQHPEPLRLFLVLEARFRARHLPAKGDDPCF